MSNPSRRLRQSSPQSIQAKLLVGYHAWFTCEGDGPPVHRGHHGWMNWIDRPLPQGGRPTFDLFPDVSSYSSSELYPVQGMTLPDGSPTRLFSSRNPETVKRHFHWLAEHGIDGVFLQRFAAHCEVDGYPSSPLADLTRFRDEIGDRVREAAEMEGRVWAIEYDIRGVPMERLARVIQLDWEQLLRDKRILDSPNYLRERGRPVIGIRGIGLRDSHHDPSALTSMVRQLRAITPGGLYIMAGVSTHWRSPDVGDQDANPGFKEFYREVDAISPWSVAQFEEQQSAEWFAREKVRGDIQEIRKWNEVWDGQKKVDYIPVIFPGYSASNLQPNYMRNEIPRQSGKFLWTQIFHFQREGARVLYAASLDGYVDSTALLPITTLSRLLPNDYRFLALDADGDTNLPPDWYLRICGMAAEALRGEKRIATDLLPKKELDDYWGARPRYEKSDTYYEAGESGSSNAYAGAATSNTALGASTQNTTSPDESDPLDPNCVPAPPPYTLEADEPKPLPPPTSTAPPSAPARAPPIRQSSSGARPVTSPPQRERTLPPVPPQQGESGPVRPSNTEVERPSRRESRPLPPITGPHVPGSFPIPTARPSSPSSPRPSSRPPGFNRPFSASGRLMSPPGPLPNVPPNSSQRYPSRSPPRTSSPRQPNFGSRDPSPGGFAIPFATQQGQGSSPGTSPGFRAQAPYGPAVLGAHEGQGPHLPGAVGADGSPLDPKSPDTELEYLRPLPSAGSPSFGQEGLPSAPAEGGFIIPGQSPSGEAFQAGSGGFTPALGRNTSTRVTGAIPPPPVHPSRAGSLPHSPSSPPRSTSFPPPPRRPASGAGARPAAPPASSYLPGGFPTSPNHPPLVSSYPGGPIQASQPPAVSPNLGTSTYPGGPLQSYHSDLSAALPSSPPPQSSLGYAPTNPTYPTYSPPPGPPPGHPYYQPTPQAESSYSQYPVPGPSYASGVGYPTAQPHDQVSVVSPYQQPWSQHPPGGFQVPPPGHDQPVMPFAAAILDPYRHTLDRYAGEERRRMLERGLGSAVGAGAKLLNKFAGPK